MTPSGWAEVVARWQRDLRAFGRELPDPEPLLVDGALVGVAGRLRIGGTRATTLWILPEMRGLGHGDAAALDLVHRKEHAVVAVGCIGDLPWYEERGFLTTEPVDGLHLLRPPTLRVDLREAASVALVDAETGRVLVGLRTAGPYLGYWAFPGGGCEPGEAPLDTAVRELREETGVRVGAVAVERVRTVFVGGAVGYRVTNHVVRIERPGDPTPSTELDARWMSLAEAVHLRPMAAGTRRILRGLG